MGFNKYTFLTSLVILATVTLISIVGGIAYKFGMEKGRLDQSSYWASQGANSTIRRVIEAVRYSVPESEITEDYQLVTTIKEAPLYLYEVNGVRTVVSVCNQNCTLDTPPSHNE